MTLDFTKTATRCELISVLTPKLAGKLWSTDGRRWHARQRNGQWKNGRQRYQHLILIHDLAECLPPDPRWDRYRELLGTTHRQYKVLQDLMIARDTGFLPRPDDFPFPDTHEVGNLKNCICFQGCWTALT